MSAIPILRTGGEGGGSPQEQTVQPRHMLFKAWSGQVAATSPAADDVPVPAEPGASLAPEPPGGQAHGRRGGQTARRRARHTAHMGPALRARAYPAFPGFTPALLAFRHRPAGGDAPAQCSTGWRRPTRRSLAVDQVSHPAQDGGPPGPSGRLGPLDGVRAGGPGGRVLALPGGTAETRGLARAAMALDAASMRVAVERAVAEHGVIPTWTELLCPVLVAVGERWAATGEGVEVEHLLAGTAGSALRAVGAAPEPRNGRPVLLACAPEEQHSLPLAALAAALAEQGIGARLLGGGLPLPSLRAAVRRTGPAAVMVWAHAPGSADVRCWTRCRCCARRWPCSPVAPAGSGGRCRPASRTHPTWRPRSSSSPARSAAEWIRRRPASGRRSRPGSSRRRGRPPADAVACGRRRPGRGRAERVRWLAGVCLGALGRYRTAARAGAGRRAVGIAGRESPGEPPPPGRPARGGRATGPFALATATGAEARADALVGLVAMRSVGTAGPARALGPAAEHPAAVTGHYAEWRIRVRLAWVSAETARLAGEAAGAVELLDRASSLTCWKACRHAVKSMLVLGVALDAAGRTRGCPRAPNGLPRGHPAGPDTPSAADPLGAGRRLQDHAPDLAERERLRACAAQSIREVPAESRSLGQAARRTDAPSRPRTARPSCRCFPA